ncbi:MAG: Gfo/Idh/MocA family protein [Pirellulaceae bacterium]
MEPITHLPQANLDPLNRPITRRQFLASASAVAVGAVPWVVPSHVLGRNGQTPPSEKITLGVLGVGDQGTADMIAFLGLPDVRVVAICDVNQRHVANARRNIAQAYGSADVKVCSDFRELNADASIDAVQMSLPEHWHSIPSIDALLQGKHAYYEKPMTMSFEESRRVRQAVRSRGVVFQFGTQQRSDSRFRWASELALNGRLGKLQEIDVSVPGGRNKPVFPEQPVPAWIDWDRWMGPAPTTPFHEEKLIRGNHEFMSNFALGMIVCWGVHHLDIAQWGNGTDLTGPCAVEGTGEFPQPGGAFDTVLNWNVRFEFERGAPVRFVNDGTPGFEHGVKFKGETGWVHVNRERCVASSEELLRDPHNQVGTMPVKLPVSDHHYRNFIEAIKTKQRAICDIETAVRSDTLCLLALIAVETGRKLTWDPSAERFVNDEAANAMLQPRPCRGDWQIPTVTG